MTRGAFRWCQAEAVAAVQPCVYYISMPAPHTLWAPWRMEYIRGPKPAGCAFCEFPSVVGIRLRRKHLILCARPHAVVILNRYPFAAGHLMVVPRRHTPDLAGLDAEEFHALFELVRDAATALRTACNADGLNVGLNLGAAAGAGIAEHLHVHLVPRWRGDLNFMPVMADVHVMPEALAETYARLYPHFAPLAPAAGVSHSTGCNGPQGPCPEGASPVRCEPKSRARKGSRR